MIILRRAFGLVRQHLRAFVLINVAYFGLVCSGMAYGAWDRDFHDKYMVESKKQAADALPVVFDAYQGGHVAKAIGLTFVVNLVAGSILYITLPSLIVPFAGLLLGAARGCMGICFFAQLLGIQWSGIRVRLARRPAPFLGG